VAGPDLDGHGAEAFNHIRTLGLEARVTMTGMLQGESKASALGNAELFVLPTYSENFGQAIAEALSYGVPVITTRAAPWPDLQPRRCGWWTEVGERALRAALQESLRLSAGELEEMGARGRELVAGKYCWPEAGDKFVDAYRWALGLLAAPAWLHT
jgi:glycosyltransferase involved in cell wall biosynthesis